MSSLPGQPLPFPSAVQTAQGRDPARYARRSSRIAWTCLLAALIWVPLLAMAAPAVGVANAPAPGGSRGLYLLSTPQIPDPLTPLAHASPAAGHVAVRSAVVTVADPLETHLGRAFDIQVSALIRAFHTRDYVLDGFALTWSLSLAGAAQDGSRIPDGGTATFTDQQRGRPSVLVFRKDLWRKGLGADAVAAGAPSASGPAAGPGAEYFVVFLVGDSPTFGVHPRAFRAAASCAALLDGTRDPALLTAPCTGEKGGLAKRRDARLRVVGPTFSGSMDSVALVLAAVLGEAPGLVVELVSPSASVTSNERIGPWVDRIAGVSGRVSYRSLALSLERQLKGLAVYARERGIEGKVAILAEESTFGQGVAALLRLPEDGPASPADDPAAAAWASFAKGARVTSFPQNIAAIRAEHSRQDRERSASMRNLLKAQSPLLELDLSGIDEVADRPPAYRRALSSRSDELMLYGAFDALRVYVKPALVVIVATDIRDRLFLLNEIRKSLPTALPVLMEMDYLTAHPDYRKISRGAVVVPNGDTLLCIAGPDNCLTTCGRDPAASDMPPKAEGDKGRARKSYLSFPADYAANMFRAALALIDRDGGRQCPGAGDATPTGPRAEGTADGRPDGSAAAPADSPAGAGLFVATMAGFQQLGPQERSRLLAADGRLLLERPAAIFFLVAGLAVGAIAWWLLVHGRTHLVMLSPLRHPNPFPGVREAELYPAGAESDSEASGQGLARRLGRWLPMALMLAGGLVALCAAVRLLDLFVSSTRNQTWDLAHGRDPYTLICLFLLYVCLAILAGWRLDLWRRRCQGHLDALADDPGIASRVMGVRDHGQIAPSLLALGSLALLLVAGFRGVPTSVDPAWPDMVVDIVVLGLGIGFLAALWSEYRRLARFAQLLAPTADLPADGSPSSSGRPAGDWANPLRLDALPQSPFSLRFRKRDLAAVLAYPDATWRDQTRALLKGEWPFEAGSSRGLEAWKSRLVAELRYGIAAIRGCAWCAILAPTVILLGMSVYPPFNERAMTTASVLLIFAAFASVMYVVIKLEQHPLLGRMFTQHGDRLSIGGVIGALWGKLIAAALILIPVLFPDVLSGLYGLLQSIDSLR